MLLDAYNKGLNEQRYNYVPNYMYYLVTSSVVSTAERYLDENNLPYGLLEYQQSKHGLDANFKSKIYNFHLSGFIIIVATNSYKNPFHF